MYMYSTEITDCSTLYKPKKGGKMEQDIYQLPLNTILISYVQFLHMRKH